MKDTYWNEKGKHQKEFQRLFEQLVPVADHCETLGGELIRSANRLCYDFYNNGLCNNTSGALNFLKMKGAIGFIDDEIYNTLYPFTCGKAEYTGKYQGDPIHLAVESVMNQTIEYILDNPELETEFNDECMFEYEDEFDYGCDEDENEYDDFPHPGW